ncbi:aspartate racemase [Nonomuraea solani]|uniref:Aspartate racemase n=1 Tax=Nonomuraea solani TaxID=1144553 RepID=A0A1H6EV51_9ACTN|nr:aspartate racemase [Nonomuraea solani]
MAAISVPFVHIVDATARHGTPRRRRGELTRNRIESASREEYRRVITDLAGRGAQAVILGCTEITLLIGPEDSPLPVSDSTRLHLETAPDLALRTTVG